VKVALLALALMSVTGASAAPRFVGTISPVKRADVRHSWRPGCPVGPSQLRLLRVSHWGFDRRARVGSIVVHAVAAREILAVFRRLYAARFPIRRIQPVEVYRGSDDASMAADNSSGFNCRFVSGTRRWSQHAYGLAIDVNPVENPYVHGGIVEPPAGRRYLDRSHVRPGMAVPNGVLVRAFAAIGWSWGGRWSPPDYQHFSATGG
jgi:D-alanyl-D-alanine carboxypeptidase